MWDRFQELLNGSVKHQIVCQYTIKRRQVEEDAYEYDITYTGEGAFDFTARYVNHYGVVIDWLSEVGGLTQTLTMDDIGIGTDSKGGDVTLEYKTTLK